MTRSRSRELATGLVLLAMVAACADSPAAPELPRPAYTSHPFTLLVWPSVAELIAGATQVFEAYASPQDPNTPPDLGPDGEPGTDDDGFQLVTVFWSVIGDIGTIDATSGAFTTLSADLPDGSTLEMGKVIGEFTGGIGEADVTVVGDSEPIAAGVAVEFFWKDRPKDEQPRPGVLSVYVTFEKGKDFVVTLNGPNGPAEHTPPAEASSILLRFNASGELTRALWSNGGRGDINFGGKTFTKVALKHPQGSNGKIQKVQQTSSAGTVITLPNGGKIDKVEVSIK